VEEPIMLPHETNPDRFIIPPGYTIDHTNALVNEEQQVDTVVFNHLDAQGSLQTLGTLLSTHFLGIGMAQNIPIKGNGPYSGVEYGDIEVLTFNFGNEHANIYVNETSEAIHVLNMGPGNDTISIKKISGPMIVNGEEGNDIVYVSSDEQKLNKILSLLAVDGGAEESDSLILDNSADFSMDDVLNVTRLLIEVESMEISPPTNETKNPVLPEDSYIIMLRNSTGGSFNLSFPALNLTSSIVYPATAGKIEDTLNSMLLPVAKSCGQLNTSQCSKAVKVWQLGDSDAFVIFFVGERLNTGLKLALDTDGLIDFYSETFLNETNDILAKNSDIAYTNIETLSITMGHHTIVSNIRGTSAETFVVTQEGHDKFFISSDAIEDALTANDTTILYGLLDYIEKDIHIESNSGRHRLLMSDSFSTIPKGVGSNGMATLSNAALVDLGDAVGDIYYSAINGNWLDDVTLWLGQGNDEINVVSIPSNAFPSRSTTSIHCGKGDDLVFINLNAAENSGALFIANGQEGNDLINATNSTLPVILFGDGVRIVQFTFCDNPSL
jgi:hypothetical protein